LTKPADIGTVKALDVTIPDKLLASRAPAR
jgi:hypothetical protein